MDLDVYITLQAIGALLLIFFGAVLILSLGYVQEWDETKAVLVVGGFISLGWVGVAMAVLSYFARLSGIIH